VTDDRSCRLAVNEHLRGRAISADGPWKVRTVDADDIAAFI